MQFVTSVYTVNAMHSFLITHRENSNFHCVILLPDFLIPYFGSYFYCNFLVDHMFSPWYSNIPWAEKHSAPLLILWNHVALDKRLLINTFFLIFFISKYSSYFVDDTFLFFYLFSHFCVTTSIVCYYRIQKIEFQSFLHCNAPL